MAQVYKKLEIDVNKEVTAIITAVQNDASSRYLDIVLLDGSTAINLTEHEVRIYGKKADGTEFYNNGEITNAPAGRCQFELTSQALAVAQDLEVQIIIFKNNVEVLSTQPFKIHVVKSLFSANAIQSSNEYGALVVLYQNLYEAYDLMTTMVQNFGVAGVIAAECNADTFWKMLEFMANYLKVNLTDLLNTVLAEASVQGVIDRLGNTIDTGGTAITGTVMGKLNKLITDNSDFVSDLNLIKASTSFTSLSVTNLPSTETEVLNISGQGFVRSFSLVASGTSSTSTLKVYVDGELLFDFGIRGAFTKGITFGVVADSAARYNIDNLSEYVDGVVSVATKAYSIPINLHFKESLRMVVNSTLSATNDFLYVTYGLVG